MAGRWQPARVHRDRAGAVRVITTEPTYDRLVQRSFEKIRQSARGSPAVLIRQLDALARIMERTTADDSAQVLLDQAAMIIQAERGIGARRSRTGPTCAGSTRQSSPSRPELAGLIAARARQLRRAGRARSAARARSGVAALEQVAGDGQQHGGPQAEHAEPLPGRQQLAGLLVRLADQLARLRSGR